MNHCRLSFAAAFVRIRSVRDVAVKIFSRIFVANALSFLGIRFFPA